MFHVSSRMRWEKAWERFASEREKSKRSACEMRVRMSSMKTLSRGERSVSFLGEAGEEAEIGEDRDQGAMSDDGVRGPKRHGVGEERRVRDELGLAPADEVLPLAARHPEADPLRRPELVAGK